MRKTCLQKETHSLTGHPDKIKRTIELKTKFVTNGDLYSNMKSNNYLYYGKFHYVKRSEYKYTVGSWF